MKNIINSMMAVKSLIMAAFTSCKKVVILIFFAISLVNCSAKQPFDAKDYELVIDKSVKKKAKIMSYNALMNGNEIIKGKVVNGCSGIEGMNWNYHFSYSQIYFDEYGNKLFEEYYYLDDKGKETLSRTLKTVRIGNKNNQIQAVYLKQFFVDGIFYTKTIHNRNTDGKLIDIVEYSYSADKKVYESRTLSSSKFDSNGNVIEVIEYEQKWEDTNKKNIQVAKKTAKFSNFTSNGYPKYLQEYDTNHQLIQEASMDYYPNSRLIHTEYIKKYQNNRLIDVIENYYVYDNNNNMVTKRNIVNGMSKLFWKTLDSKNNLTHENDGRIASYKYNGNGDWIEQIIYDEYTHLPTGIIERTFTYY